MRNQIKKENEFGEELPELENRDAQSKVTIDEFGQFKRKKSWETDDSNERSYLEVDGVSWWQMILRYFKKIFTPRNGTGVFRLVLFLIFVISTCWSASSHGGGFILYWVIPSFFWLIIEVFISNLRGDTNKGNTILYIVIFTLILLIINLASCKNKEKERRSNFRAEKAEDSTKTLAWIDSAFDNESGNIL